MGGGSLLKVNVLIFVFLSDFSCFFDGARKDCLRAFCFISVFLWCLCSVGV